MDPKSFETYTKRLQFALASRDGVIGLVTLGSTADSNLRDEWSDHDFWVITTPGVQGLFLADLSWLPDVDNIAITVCHMRGRTVLYRNRHKVEFRVLDVSETRSEGKAERYQVLIDRGQIAELMEVVHRETILQARSSHPGTDGLNNLCVLVWSACERYSRGELLSARQYIDGFAVNQLLNLIDTSDTETVDRTRDELDPRRRLELRSPLLAGELLTALEESVPEAALRLLDIAEREVRPKLPALAWDKVTLVRDWITALRKS